MASLSSLRHWNIFLSLVRQHTSTETHLVDSPLARSRFRGRQVYCQSGLPGSALRLAGMKRGSLAWAGVGVGTPPVSLEGERLADDCLLFFFWSREEPMKDKSNMLMLERSLRLKPG